MGNQSMVHPYHEIPLSNKEEIYMLQQGWPQNRYGQWKKPRVKDHAVDTITMFNIKSLEKQIYRDWK